jgi:homoserine dehydrogenase
MTDDLASNRIESVRGILNGTTNFVLSRMEEGVPYADALDEARELGYAERDPSADVGGFDSARKIVILAALAFGKLIPIEKISIRGIDAVTPEELAEAKRNGCRIKLVAETSLTADGRIYAAVAPEAVPPTSLFYSVGGVFNAVSVTGNMLGEAVFYGRGAGREATAGAVVADIIDAAERRFAAPPALMWTRARDEDLSPVK